MSQLDGVDDLVLILHQSPRREVRNQCYVKQRSVKNDHLNLQMGVRKFSIIQANIPNVCDKHIIGFTLDSQRPFLKQQTLWTLMLKGKGKKIKHKSNGCLKCKYCRCIMKCYFTWHEILVFQYHNFVLKNKLMSEKKNKNISHHKVRNGRFPI